MATAVGGTIAGFSKIKQGKKIAKAAQQGIDNFEWQDLTNPYKDLAISTAGAEMRVDEAARATATSVEALRGAGQRGLIGGLGRVQAQNNLVSRDIAANLDEQQKSKDFAAAGQDINIQAMEEKRQADELAGYGNMLDVGMDMQNSGKGDIVAGLRSGDETFSSIFGGVMGRGK